MKMRLPLYSCIPLICLALCIGCNKSTSHPNGYKAGYIRTVTTSFSPAGVASSTLYISYDQYGEPSLATSGGNTTATKVRRKYLYNNNYDILMENYPLQPYFSISNYPYDWRGQPSFLLDDQRRISVSTDSSIRYTYDSQGFLSTWTGGYQNTIQDGNIIGITIGSYYHSFTFLSDLDTRLDNIQPIWGTSNKNLVDSVFTSSSTVTRNFNGKHLYEFDQSHRVLRDSFFYPSGASQNSVTLTYTYY